MNKQFTPDWKSWLVTNVNAGQDLDGIFKILLDEGFSYETITKEMSYQPSKHISELVNPFVAKAILQKKQQIAQQQKLARINNNGVAIEKNDIVLPNAIAINNEGIDLRTIDSFLSQDECQKIIDIIKSKLRPSELSNDKVDKSYRNSRTCDLGHLNDEFIEEIDIRICQLMGIERAYSEFLQGQYYEVGEEFKAHTDYFEKNEFTSNCHEFGQRTYTLMIYLNDVEKGGETCFVNINKAFAPKAGTAVIWNNLTPNGSPNRNTMHQSNPVEQGYKAIITKWFRSKPAAGTEHIKMFSKDN